MTQVRKAPLTCPACFKDGVEELGAGFPEAAGQRGDDSALPHVLHERGGLQLRPYTFVPVWVQLLH